MVDHALVAEAEMLLQRGYDASDPEQVEKAKKIAAREVRDHLQFTHKIMATAAGRKWMIDILLRCRSFEMPIVPNDIQATYFQLGEQNIGKYLLQIIGDSSPDEYFLMLREDKERKVLSQQN